MDMNTKTTVTKSAGFSKRDGEMAEEDTTQANETYEKMNAATTEAADLIKNSHSTAIKGLQDYNNKFIEFAHANANAAFDFVQKLFGVKSPSAFVELSTEHACKQLETLTEQTKQLAALAQKVMLATGSHSRRASQKRSTNAASDRSLN
jgi:phasin